MRNSASSADRPAAERRREEKREIIKELCVARDSTEHIADIINKVRKNRDLSDEPMCVLITGDIGTGKSAFLRNYLTRSSKRRSRSGNLIQPLVHIALDSAVTMLGAAKMIACALEDPSLGVGKLHDVTDRIRTLRKAEETESFVIDEFQHLVDTGSRTISKVGDWIKQLSKSTNKPFVMVGMPDSTRIIDENGQFAGITNYRETLGMFGFKKDGERRVFRKFLAEVDSKLPFGRVAGLGDMHIATALFYASDGSMRPLMTLIRQAAGHAIDRGVAAIGMADLAYGFEQIERNSKLEQNPFSDQGILLDDTKFKDAS